MLEAYRKRQLSALLRRIVPIDSRGGTRVVLGNSTTFLSRKSCFERILLLQLYLRSLSRLDQFLSAINYGLRHHHWHLQYAMGTLQVVLSYLQTNIL